ncbi:MULTISPECIES: hypothetical protein [Mesorhizobium]|uniref:hypothetical protein n=1 Tax=Mesorhizobium TaxID=68287 RepID=UPI0010A97B2D|nr:MULTISPECIES: hypothetical protein [Mesorhizobium]
MSAPLDHVARGYDRVCDASGKPHIVCRFWPECQCGENCDDQHDTRMMRRILVGFIAAVLAIAGGLFIWGMRS